MLSFSEDGQTLLIGDMRRRTAGSCLQNPDSTRSGGVFDVWTRVGVTNSDFCDWNRTGIGFINDGRRGRRLGWDVAIDEAVGEFVTSNLQPASPKPPSNRMLALHWIGQRDQRSGRFPNAKIAMGTALPTNLILTPTGQTVTAMVNLTPARSLLTLNLT